MKPDPFFGPEAVDCDLKGFFDHVDHDLLMARVVAKVDKWIRRRVRQCYWKQWKRSRQRRRMLLKLGADPREVYLASRSRKGCWRMSTNSIVQAALTNEWMEKQGVPNLQASWIAYHYPEQTTPSAEASAKP